MFYLPQNVYNIIGYLCIGQVLQQMGSLRDEMREMRAEIQDMRALILHLGSDLKAKAQTAVNGTLV